LDKEILKKALLLGIGSGVLTWTLFSLAVMLFNHKPANEAFFGSGSIIFLIVFVIVEIISYYFSIKKKKNNPNP